MIRWRETRAWLRGKGRERLQKGSEMVDTSSGNGRDKVGCYGWLTGCSSLDISASNCDASHYGKYQDGEREALLLERITAGCKRPLDR